MKNIIFATFLLISNWSISQCLLSKGIGGLYEDKAISTSVDNSGNVYVTGYFKGFNVDFDPGPASFILSTSTSPGSAFLSKFDPNGNFLWAIRFGPNGFCPRDMVLDYLGNPIICGGNYDFGITNGGTPLGGRVFKFDSSGTLVWDRIIGGRPSSIAASSANNIQAGLFYIVGSFEGTQDFDPDINNSLMKTSVGGSDIFILSLGVDTGLGAQVRTIGGPGNDYGMGFTINSQGNKFVTGAFSGTVDFDFGTANNQVTNLTSNGLLDCFVLKLTQPTGLSFSSAVSFGGSGNDIGMDVVIDNFGNIYTTGSFENTVDFNPSTGVFNLASNGGKDVFVNKFDINLNYLWVKKSGSTNSDEGLSIAVDGLGNIFSTGYYSGTADFNPGTPVNNLISSGGSNDIFIWKLDSNGNFILANSYGGNDDDKGLCVVSDANGNLYSVGFFSSIADFDPGIGVSNLNSNGGNDIYIQFPFTDIPTITASGPISFCPGLTVTLTSSNPMGNTWSTGETTQSIVVGSAGDYSVSISNDACSNSSFPLTVTLLNAPNTPTISASGPTTFCSGGNITLTSSSLTGNTWSNGETTQSIIVNSSGNYTVTVSNGTCSTTSNSQQINVITYPVTPTITASGSTSFCPGGSVTLTSSSANGNTWSTGETTQSINVSSAGSYSVSNSNSSCVSNSNPVIVSLLNAPSIPVISTSGSTSFCQGDSVVLTSSSVTGNLWSNGETTPSIVVNTSGDYSVSVFNGTCSTSSNPIQVEVISYPVPPNISANGPTTFCPGESVTLTSSYANGNNWNTSETTPSITVDTAGLYYVSIANGNCISNSDSIEISILSAPSTPNLTASGSTTFCEGDSVVLTSSIQTDNTWSNGETSQSIIVNSSGTYSVMVSNGSCTSTSTPLNVTVISLPTINSQPTNKQVNIGNQAIFSVASNGNSYQWQMNNGAGFQNIFNGGQFSGVTTNTLIVSNTTLSNNNNQFRCMVSNNNCSTLSDEVILTVLNNVGLEEGQTNNFMIFPNPTNDYFNLKSNHTQVGNTFELVDNFGRVVLSGKITSDNTLIDASNLSSGIYNIKVQGEKTTTVKLVKN